MIEITLTPNLYFALALNGLFTGLGSALGSYLATKGIIERITKLTERIKGKNDIKEK